MDTAFSPSLYLDRDKQALAFIEDRLRHQESCAAVCMYGNGKDYLFANVVKRFENEPSSHALKVLNTVSADELRAFTNKLRHQTTPTLCLVNLRIGKDVSWFIRDVHKLRVERGQAFVSYISSYVGDVWDALQATEKPITHSLVMLKRVSFDDAQHILTDLAERFEFDPSDEQRQDIYRWSYGHVGLLRTLFLLKRQAPERMFSAADLLREPTVLERLNNLLRDIPAERLEAIMRHRLTVLERTFLEEMGYIDSEGNLFHPLLATLLPEKRMQLSPALSLTEARVLEYLQSRPDAVVSREEIAQIVWGAEEWQDKYSDWAIGQLIYRLRRKLAQSASPAAIQTRKEQGFAWVE